MHHLLKPTLLIATLLLSATASAQTPRSSAPEVNAIYPDIEKLYIDLHRNPELAFHEQRKAAGAAVRAAGVDQLDVDTLAAVDGVAARAVR